MKMRHMYMHHTRTSSSFTCCFAREAREARALQRQNPLRRRFLGGQRSAVKCRSVTSATAELEQSWNYLRDYTEKDARGVGRLNIDSKDRQALRQALLTVASQPWPQASYSPEQESRSILIGVMSSDIRLAVRSLRDYCVALELPFLLPESTITTAPILSAIKGPVYIKYNLQSRKCYVTAYQGRDRGVLVNFGLEQVGHLPLGLWDESMVNAPPPVD